MHSGGHGGPGRGGGRKKGDVSKKTAYLRAVAAKALAEGITPLEVMLKNMRFYDGEAQLILADILRGIGNKRPMELVEMLQNLGSFRKNAQECARDAAPYTNARISAVTLSGDSENPIKIDVEDAVSRIVKALNSSASARSGSTGASGRLDADGPSKPANARR